MEDLYPMGKERLERTGAAIKFMVVEATVLVNRAEEFHVKIANVRV
jgi:ribosome-associated protein YbcJ (S4-like RNA binding protein)